MNLQQATRRQFFADCGIGVGKLALTSLLAGSTNALASATDHMGSGGLHHAAKAKRVIFLFMAGAPSQLDMFDNKPELTRLEGKPIPPSVIAGQRYAFIQPNAAVLAPRFKFARYGESGAELSEVLKGMSKNQFF